MNGTNGTNDSNETGHKIRSLRERRAWTQEQLAQAARISPRTVQRAEEGAMSAETRLAIAAALDIPVETLAPLPKPPEGWPRITPTLCYEDSRAAVPWLEKAFGFVAREKVANGDGQIIHSELVLGDGVIMVGNVKASPSADGRWASPKALGGKVSQSLFVFVDDLDAHCERARRRGDDRAGDRLRLRHAALPGARPRRPRVVLRDQGRDLVSVIGAGVAVVGPRPAPTRSHLSSFSGASRCVREVRSNVRP